MDSKLARLITLSVVALFAVGCATTPDDQKQPEVNVAAESPTYISPASSAGVEDVFVSPVQAVLREDTGVRGYSIAVREEGGTEVYRLSRRAKGEEERIEFPNEIGWTGRNQGGNFVTDGAYLMTVSLTDSAGRSTESEPVRIVVDNTPPTASVNSEYGVFSPGGEGRRNVVPIRQQGSDADTWIGQISDDEGSILRRWEWSESLPETIEWDGRNDNGDLVGDGRYSYTLTGQDRAGNRVIARQNNIRVSTEVLSVSITAAQRHFSPNGDGVNDSADFEVELSGTAEINEWVFTVRDGNGQPVEERTGEGSIPATLEFSGRTADSAFPEGTYRARVNILQRNGERQESSSGPVTLDVTAPTAEVSSEYQVFSPRDNSERSVVPIRQQGSGADTWTGEIRDSQGSTVRRWEWSESLAENIEWDGRDDNGELVSDGRYRYVLTGRDLAGNNVVARQNGLRVSTDVRGVSVTPGRLHFSPNGDGVRDTVDFEIALSGGADIDEWVFTVLDSSGETVEDRSGQGEPPANLEFSGRTDGSELPEGEYRGRLSFLQRNGERQENTSDAVTLDVTAPTAEVSSEYSVFSPGGESQRRVVPIRQQGNGADTWSGEVRDNEGGTVRRWEWSDSVPESLEWDGRNDSGQLVADGQYSYVLTGRDLAGNRVIARQDDLRVSTDVRGVSVNASHRQLSPNGDGVRESVNFEISLSGNADIDEWMFTVVDSDDDTVDERSGQGEPPNSFEFDGRTADGVLPEGDYRGTLSLLQRNGKRQENTSDAVTLDVTAPAATVEAGAEVTSGSLTITQSSDGASSWEGSIVLAGGGESILSVEWDEELPQEFTWNGQTGSGGSAATGEYRYVLRATDRAGNSSTVESASFVLDREAPSVEVEIEPRPFYPATDGDGQELRITVQASDRSEIEEWQVTIYDPEGREFAQFGGEGTPPSPITWNGRGDNGDLPASARDYTAAVTVVDALGNQSTTERTVPMGIVVERNEDGDLQFSITGIRFASFEADFQNLSDAEVVSQNQQTLDQIAELLNRYPDQDVLIEGHAVHIYYRGSAMEREQQQVLLPLSQRRAQAVLDALVERGVDEDRLTAVGRGGSEPLVPHSDMQNRWKNRRVEFELR